jgi:VWFA-related protein
MDVDEKPMPAVACIMTQLFSPNEKIKMRPRGLRSVAHAFLLISTIVFAWASADAQPQTPGSITSGKPGRPVTIPLTIHIKESQREVELQNIDLTVNEDGEPQTVLSLRGMGTGSLTLALLIQEDLLPPVQTEIKALAEFIRRLPRGSRVMIGYLRAGSMQVRHKFTTDLERAASALRPPIGFASAGPYNPYVEVVEAVKRFDSQPLGRRAILLVSDGLDLSRGIDSSSPTFSVDLQRAIREAQRRSIAIYGFYSPTLAAERNRLLATNAQSSLLRLSNETGGQAYFQGTGAPVSFDPFIRDLVNALERQAALTFLSTHTDKGFHKIQVHSSTPGVRVAYPSGYVR